MQISINLPLPRERAWMLDLRGHGVKVQGHKKPKLCLEAWHWQSHRSRSLDSSRYRRAVSDGNVLFEKGGGAGCGQILGKSDVGKFAKCHLVYQTKNSEPTFCTKFTKRCHAATCACAQNLVRITWGLPELLPKYCFLGPPKWLQYRLKACVAVFSLQWQEAQQSQRQRDTLSSYISPSHLRSLKVIRNDSLMDYCTAVSDIPSWRHLQSATRHHLTVPLSIFGRRTFSVAGPTARSGNRYQTVSVTRRSPATASDSRWRRTNFVVTTVTQHTQRSRDASWLCAIEIYYWHWH